MDPTPGAATRRIAARLALACTLALGAALAGLPAAPVEAAAKRASPISWPTEGFQATRTGYNGREGAIGRANAHHLHELWSADLGAVMIAQPVEAAQVTVNGALRSIIYEGTEHGEFYAIQASTGRVIWERDLGSQATRCFDMPDGVFGVGGTAAISFTSKHAGVVYVAGGDGAVHALDLATGAERPGWPVHRVFNPVNEAVYGGLNLFDGRLYVPVASHCSYAPYHGGVAEIGVARHAILNRFYPAGPPSRGVSGGSVWGPGGVSIDPSNQDVLAAPGNALGRPYNYRYSEAVVEFSRSLGVRSSVKPHLGDHGDEDFGSTPVLFRPAGCPVTLAAAENKTGALFVYSVGAKLGARNSQRLQMGDYPRAGFKGDPAWDPVTNTLYVANTSDSSSGPFKHGLVALKANGNCRLSFAWQRKRGLTKAIGLPPPTVANGVVYFGDGAGNTEYAFNAATGRELWHSSAITGSVYAPATVVNGRVFVPAWDGKLYAFGVAKS
jgi:outer membrane protein assembly factor BamB